MTTAAEMKKSGAYSEEEIDFIEGMITKME